MGLGTGSTGPFIFFDRLSTVPCVVGVKVSQKLMKQKVAWLNASHGVKVKHFLQHIHKNNSLHSFLFLKRRDLEMTTNLK